MLGPPTDKVAGEPVLELASLRAGGATDLYVATESWSLVQQRGRWQSLRVMQLYIQELVSQTFFARLSRASQQRVLLLCRAAPLICEKARSLLEAGTTSTLWHASMLSLASQIDVT